MKNTAIIYIGKKLQKSIVLFLKVLTFLMLFATFYLLFSIPNQQMLRLSRTTAVTIFTFIVVEWAMISAYGTYDIGKRKSKPIIYSLGLATVITDVVAYIQLAIMNTNAANNLNFRLENIGLLILAIVLQIIEIIAMSYFGNFIFFSH